MKKILFPFELDNPIYKEAYIYAVRFARNLNTEVILLNTFSIEADDDITQEKYAKQIKDNWIRAYNEISKFNKYYLEDHARVDDELRIKFDYRFIHGFLKDEIKNIAREEEVGFIFLPVSEKKETNKRQLEIIRDNIFEKNRASLLVIPSQGSYRPVRNIVFSIDLKRIKNFAYYLEEASHFARAFDANIHFLHIISKDNQSVREDSEEYQMVQKVIEKNSRHLFRQEVSKNVVEAVNRYVEENQADLLAVVKHHHFFLETLFHKSFTNEITLNSKVPVLVMREKED